MKSLYGRLLLATLLVITTFWIIWSWLYVMYMTREQSGWLDYSLRDIAHQVLTSLPEDIASLSSQSRLRLQADDAGNNSANMSFQIWSLPNTVLLRSVESPSSPLQAEMRDGFSLEEIDGRQWRVYAVTDSTGRVQVQTGKPVDQLRHNFWKWTKVAAVVAILIFMILGITLGKVIRWSLRPVTRLRQNMTQRNDYDFAPLSSAGLPREVRPLVDSFNRLLLRIDRAINNERQFIADAAHELRTPLAAVQAHTHVALRARTPEEARAALDKLLVAVERGTRLAQQLLDSARLEATNGNVHEVLNLAELVSMVTHEFDSIAGQRGQTIELNAQTASILGNVDDLGILVRNLLDNALRYSGEQSRVKVECRTEADDRHVLLCVSDNGPGVPDESDRQRLFDRFFRAGGNGQRGSGIGLALVRRIAESHGAEIDVTTPADAQGLAICIRFPGRNPPETLHGKTG